MSSKIEWTENTWNPIRGCSHVSPGCDNCYAERMAARFSGPGMPYEGLVESGRWNGHVRLDRDVLEKPRHWKKPRMVFVDSMSDLFHDGLTDLNIIHIFEIMYACPQHTFQILTKRPNRMLELLRKQYPVPIENVWLGVTCENQAMAEERIPLLMQTPAALRFVSCEPLLGPITLQTTDNTPYAQEIEYLSGYGEFDNTQPRGIMRHEPVDWVIIGAESGPDARPMELDWARDLVSQCQDNGTPVFVKQLCVNGHKLPFEQWPEDIQVRQFPEGK